MRSERSFLAKVLAAEGVMAAVVAMGILAAVAGAVTPGAGGKTQTLEELQAKFDHEENPVHKAKLIEKLGDAQFEALHAAEKAEDYNAVGLTLEKYRDNVGVALAGLKKEHPDAERQSNGYRQLQMHLRRGIREVREALVTSPEEFRPPLELVEKDLTAMDDELLRMLFPSPSAGKAAKKEVKP